jgi:muramidase (phage lysozyme)
MSPNQSAFLAMIRWSEIGPALLAESDDGYNVIVGSTPAHPDLFTSYADHPRKLVHLTPTLASTAAGAYQILARYFDVYKRQLNLPDFGHASQDAIALQMIRETGSLSLIDGGSIRDAIARCSSRWASLPGNNYGQHVNDIDALLNAYAEAGGSNA